jgi:hypothetical protein
LEDYEENKMASLIQTPSGSSARIGPLATDKIRIATTGCAIAINVGNSNVSANTTACEVIPANTVDNSFIVGQGNYLAYITANGTAAPFSVTELGMPHAVTGTE